MTIKNQLRQALNAVLAPLGLVLLRNAELEPWQRPGWQPPQPLPRGPEDAGLDLRPDHPRLLELQHRYAPIVQAFMPPAVWTQGKLSAHDMANFRGENPYVWQFRGPNMNPLAYALTYYHVAAMDRHAWLERMHEDGRFGAITLPIDGKAISRDLLDSLIEMYFLDRHLQLATREHTTILDIGAGYGRMAHRLCEALGPHVQVLCTDAYAPSSFLCEQHLKARGLQNQARVVPLDEVSQTLAAQSVDLAMNIHSFSECTLPAIDWWVQQLAQHRVRYFLVIPNPMELRTNSGEDFSHILERHGYRLRVKEPKYLDPVLQTHAINPSMHYLFELS
jgi:hypothetical protein